MVGWLEDDELEVVVSSKYASEYDWRGSENPQKKSVMITGLQAKIWTPYLPNTKQSDPLTVTLGLLLLFLLLLLL